MKYIDVLFISSMEYNIYFYWPTTYKCTIHIVLLNALITEYILIKMNLIIIMVQYNAKMVMIQIIHHT